MGFIYWYLIGDCIIRFPKRIEEFFLHLDDHLGIGGGFPDMGDLEE